MHKLLYNDWLWEIRPITIRTNDVGHCDRLVPKASMVPVALTSQSLDKECGIPSSLITMVTMKCYV